VLFGAFALYLIAFHRQMVRGRWLGLVLFFALPVLIVMPMVVYLQQHPELEQRLGQVGAETLEALKAGNPMPLLTRLGSTLLMFSFQGDPEWLYNISGRPVFDPVTAVAFYGGVFGSLWQWRKPKRAFVLIWLAVGLVPTMLSWPSGSLGHSIAAQPVAMVFPALFLVALWQQLDTHRMVRWAVRGLVIATILVFGAISGVDYFARWPQYPDVRHEYQAPITAAARYLREHDARTDPGPSPGDGPSLVAISAPYVDYWNPWSKRNFDLFYNRRRALGSDDAAVRWFNGTSSILFPGGIDGGQETLYVLPDHIRLPSTMDSDLYGLLSSGARVLETGHVDLSGTSFDVYLWQDRHPLEQRLQSVASSPAWASAEGPYVPGQSELERRTYALPMDVGHRLSLLGYAYGQEQVARGTPARVTTYWQVLDENSDPLAIFVHLLDDTNSLVAGWDGLHVSTETWQPGDIVIQVHQLQLPSDVSPGVYRVELGVYSPTTLERLNIYTGSGDTTAPQARLLLLPISAR
jgi:hypothetical protein